MTLALQLIGSDAPSPHIKRRALAGEVIVVHIVVHIALWKRASYP